MVAYRKEGIWHYFDTNGKLMWEPFMDVASFPNGWCNGLLKATTLEITGNKAADIGFERKQVLYDKKGKVVFQPLAHESGKIVLKPQFEFNSENVPQIENGYWSINVTLPDKNHRFDFYNFQGKLVMSSTAEKDGWDYILPQEKVTYFYKMY